MALNWMDALSGTLMPSPADDFASFVEELDMYFEMSDGLGYKHEKSLSLFDIIELWLVLGRGLQECPTYQSFLIGCIGIMEWAAKQDPAGEGHVWRGREFPTFESSRYGDIFPSERPHPLLYEDHYEALKARLAAAMQSELRRKLDAILARTNSTPGR